MTWDISSPADTDPIRQGANAIRSFKQDIQTALTTEGVFPGAAPGSPVYRWKPRRDVSANRPANDPVNPGTVYVDTDLNDIVVDTGTAWTPIANIIPPGLVMAYAATSAPAGWILCDGSPINRTTYAALFSVIGTAHGIGDGTTTFNVPDYRGQFLRGVDGAAGRDPDSGSRLAMQTGGNTGNAVGSIETDATRAHTHAITDPGHSHHILTAVNLAGSSNARGFSGPNDTDHTETATTGITINSTTGNETRPTNAFVNYLIKT